MRRPSRACSGTGQTASGTYAPPPAGLCSSALTVTSVHPAHLPFLLPPLYTRCRPVTRGEIPSKRRGQSGPASDCQKTLLGGLEGPQARNLNRRGGRWPRPPLVSVDSSGSLCASRKCPQGTRFPPSPPNEIRIQRHVRWIRKPCVARFPCAFPRPRRRRRGNVFWRKRSPQASFFDKLRRGQSGPASCMRAQSPMQMPMFLAVTSTWSSLGTGLGTPAMSLSLL